MKIFLRTIFALSSLLFLIPSLRAQAVYTATQSSRIEVGAGGMYLRPDYVNRRILGATIWADYDFFHIYNISVGAEGEAHFGNLITPNDVGENTYLIGPRLSYRRRKANVYAKALFGRGSIFNQSPLPKASASFNVVGLGGGIEYRLTRKINLRPLDAEVDRWPDFEPHTLSPIAISFGVMYTIR